MGIRAGGLAGGVALVVAAVASNAGAALVASDSYVIGTDRAAGQYAAASLNSTAQDNLVTPGFVTGRYASGTGTGNFTATDTGLANATVGSTSAGSGKVNWISAPLDSLNRSVARGLSPAAPASATYWVSHLVNRGEIPAGGGQGAVLAGFGNTVFPSAGATSGTLAGLYVGFADPVGNLVIRTRTTATNTTSDTVLIDGATANTFGLTYHVLAKIDVNAGGGSADTVSWWVNPGDPTSEATLTASSAASGSFSSFAVAVPADFARLSYAAFNWNGTAFFDEPRLSTDLAGLALVPEPAGLAVVAAGCVGLLGRRRRRA